MNFVPGSVRLSDITNGTLAAGSIPFQRTSRTNNRAANTGVITVLAGFTEVVQIDLATVVIGDWVLISGTVRMSKSGAAGQCQARLDFLSGTATIVWPCGGIPFQQNINSLPNANSWEAAMSGFFPVTGAGTLVMGVRAASANSNSVVQIGDGGVVGVVLYGS